MFRQLTRLVLGLCACVGLACVGLGSICTGQDRQVKPAFAGPTDDGFLLPNGWHLTPVGKHIESSDMVLNIRPMADNRHAIATTNGFNEHTLMLLDLVDHKILAEEKSLQSWFGLAVDAAESKVWWSGGGAGYLHQFELKNKAWQRLSQPEPDSTKFSREELTALRDKLRTENAFRSGVLLDEKRHTDGTRPGAFTPQACVASNDQALGKLVDAVSRGPLWKETAIFVIEDDAQNGPDHVDAHRTVSLVISPYTKRALSIALSTARSA